MNEKEFAAALDRAEEDAVTVRHYPEFHAVYDATVCDMGNAHYKIFVLDRRTREGFGAEKHFADSATVERLRQAIVCLIHERENGPMAEVG